MSLENNIWWSKKSKIHQEIRLLKYELHSQLLLIWYSLFTLGASILTASPDNSLNITINPNLLIIFSILTLVMSCFVTSLNFKERIIKIKNCYENLVSIDTSKPDASILYSNVLKLCENHSETDYLSAKFNEIYSTKSDLRTEKIDRLLTPYELFKYFRNLISYYFKLLILYTLPILIISSDKIFSIFK